MDSQGLFMNYLVFEQNLASATPQKQYFISTHCSLECLERELEALLWICLGQDIYFQFLKIFSSKNKKSSKN